MTALRALVRLARAAGHALRGLAIVLFAFPTLGLAERRAHVQRWSARLLALLGVRLEVTGQPHGGPVLLAANHVSWLDIAALHAVVPQARFVSKADVRHWPVLNRLIDAGGTLYIERERSRDALRVVHQIAGALVAGDSVAVFPEGTTSDGHALLPFHANLLQAAVVTGAAVQPVALRFADATHAISPAVAFVGETTLLESLWRVAGADALHVTLQLLPSIDGPHAERRALAERVRERIAAALEPAGR